MFKKIITSLFILQVLLSSVSYGIESVGGNLTRQPMDITANLNLDQGDVVIDYKDITAQNAGTIINSWKGKSNFKNRFILTGGTYLQIDQEKFNQKTTEITNFQKKLEDLEKANKKAGKLVLAEPEMIQYPDRISIKQDYSLVFENKKEFENFQINISKSNSIKKEVQKSMNDKRLSREGDLLLECIKEGYCKTGKDKADVYLKIKNILKGGKMTLGFTQQVNYNLIPLDISNLNEVNSPTFNLKLEPRDVRISKSVIMDRFNKIATFNQTVTNVNDVQLNASGVDLDKTFVKKATANSSSSVNSNSSPQEYCGYYYMEDEPQYADCIGVKTRMDAITESESSKLMLNGFTIGNSWSDDFNKTVSVPKPRKPWENTTIFRARANRTFSYGVGLRIPFLVQTHIRDRGVSHTAILRYGAKIDTVDMNANQYRQVGLPNQHIFGGKEFVLEVKASVFAKVVLFGEDLVNNTWGLGDLLPRNTPGRVSDGIDLGRNFKPPFGDQERVGLTDVTIPIPVVDIDVASVKIDLIIKAYIEGIMRAQLDFTNFTNPDQRVTFDNTDFKYFNLNPEYSSNPEGYHTVIGDVGKGIINLGEFDYRPRLTFQLQAEPILEVWIPGRGHEDWSFGTYDIYSFQIDPGVGLTRHRGTQGSINVNNIFIYRMNPQISQAKQEDNARIARMERNREIAGDMSSSRGFSAEDLGLQVDMYGNPISSSSSSSRSSGPGRIQDEEGMENLGVIDRAREQARSGGNSGSSSSSNTLFRNILGNKSQSNFQLNISGADLIGGYVLDLGTGSSANLNITGSKYTSKDDFVNSKLAEINSGYVQVYNDYFATIDDYIKKFTEGMNSAKDKIEKNKYESALNKLLEIKEIFMTRYKFIVRYAKGIFTPEMLVINTDSLRGQFGNQQYEFDGNVGNRNNNNNGIPNSRIKYNEIKELNTKMPGCEKYDIKIGELSWSSCDMVKSTYGVAGISGSNYYNQTDAKKACPRGYRLPTAGEVEQMFGNEITPADLQKYNIVDLYNYNKPFAYAKILGFSMAGYLEEYNIPGRDRMTKAEKDKALFMRFDLTAIGGKVYMIIKYSAMYWTSTNNKALNVSLYGRYNPITELAPNSVLGFGRCVKN